MHPWLQDFLTVEFQRVKKLGGAPYGKPLPVESGRVSWYHSPS
jgi:hypothetical protein